MGPQCPGAGVTDGGQGARRRRGSDRGEAGRRPQGSQTPEPGSIVVGAEGRGSKTALETREAAPWSLSRRVPGEAVMAAPWDQGNRAVPRRSLAAWCDVVCFLFFVFLRAPRVPAEPAEHPTQVMRNPPGTQRRSLLPLDASIV